MPGLIATVLMSALLGLLIGSFLNVVIGRVPAGESVVQPPSHCPACGTTLRAVDNIPVVSWLVLRARCRTCGVPISAQYPAVEAGTAVLFALVAWRVGAHADLPALLIAAAGFVALSVIDLHTKRLPDRVVFPTLAMTAVALVAAAVVDDRWADLSRAGIGALAGFVVFLLIHLAQPRGLGFGDVKLALLCGLVLGWSGLADVVLGLYGGFLLGAVVGLAVMAVRKGGRKTAIPFGPFMALGTMLQLLLGGPLADALRDRF